MGAMKVYVDGAWQTVAPFSERASVYVGPNAPAGTAYAGDLWWDTDEPPPPVPGQELAYNQTTANTNITATAAPSAQLVIDGTSRTYDGSPIVVSFYAAIALPPSPGWLFMQLWDDTADLGTICQLNLSGYAGMFAQRRITPTSGTHNYKIKAWVSTGSGTIYATPGGAGNNHLPAFIRVTRV